MVSTSLLTDNGARTAYLHCIKLGTNINPGDKWGELFDCAWFHFTAKIPQSAKDEKIVFVIDINGEGLIFDNSGCPLRGITNINSEFDRAMGNPGKRIVQFKDKADGNEIVDFWMDAGCNDLIGKLRENGTVKEAYIATCNDSARDLFYDGIVLLTQAENTSAEDPMRYEIIEILSRCHRILHNYNNDEIRQCLAITKERLSHQGGDGKSMYLTAFGHGHLDLAWWWPIRETKRKGARTFATALELMGRYDDYHFGASQGQLYQWIKEDYPALYNKVKKAVADGRWELLGAVWVECDANVVSGESLVRQILYGNAFWEKEFEHRSRYVWMPDTFGYTAAMPQILKKSGIDYFATIKMSWNLINRFPYTNFRWRGLDGSEVLVHMPPEGNYLSEATAKSVASVKRNLAKSNQFGEALLPFGIGDGGGGPSPCHLEYLKREKNMPGLCPIEQGTMGEFFDRLSERAETLPVWDDEMYLERHLGVYTSAARSKKYNRLMELILRDGEMLSAFAMKLCGTDYPQAEFERIWKEVLLYQFHDILPGSSIKRVYDESLERYSVLYREADGLRRSAVQSIADIIDTSEFRKPVVVFNTLSFERDYWINTGGKNQLVTLPALGYTVVETDTNEEKYEISSALENEYLCVGFSTDGSIASLYQKELDKELLGGASNVLLIYKDVENAWNLQYDYRNQIPQAIPLSQSQFEQEGPLKRVVQTYHYDKSTIELTLMLRPGQKYLEISARADWQQRDAMLRIQFAPAIKAAQVNCEVQFGHIARSTRNNTPQEQAQIEMVAHKWLALSEPGLNFALLNDCKYGYSVFDNIIEMNVLRGTHYPGKDLDQGTHTFRYGIYADSEQDYVKTVQQGFSFNVAPVVEETYPHEGVLNKKESWLSFHPENIIVDGVKKAEDSNGLIIRTYEAAGKHGNASVISAFPEDRYELCDLIENSQAPLAGQFSYAPFEIISLKEYN